MKREKLIEDMEDYFSPVQCLMRERQAFLEGWKTRDRLQISIWASLLIVIAGSFLGFLLAAAAWAFISSFFHV